MCGGKTKESVSMVLNNIRVMSLSGKGRFMVIGRMLSLMVMEKILRPEDKMGEKSVI